MDDLRAVLDGGPRDGQTTTVSPGIDTINGVFTWPLPMPPPRPTKPRWWRFRARRAWKRWQPPIVPPREDHLIWRDTGRYREGCRVFALTTPWESWRADIGLSLDADDDVLVHAVYTVWAEMHPALRADPATRWACAPDWYYRLRRISDRSVPPMDEHLRRPVPALLGGRVEVDPAERSLALVNPTYPAGWPG